MMKTERQRKSPDRMAWAFWCYLVKFSVRSTYLLAIIIPIMNASAINEHYQYV